MFAIEICQNVLYLILNISVVPNIINISLKSSQDRFFLICIARLLPGLLCIISTNPKCIILNVNTSKNYWNLIHLNLTHFIWVLKCHFDKLKKHSLIIIRLSITLTTTTTALTSILIQRDSAQLFFSSFLHMCVAPLKTLIYIHF